GSPNEFLMMAGRIGHPTREAAEREAAEWRASEPEADPGVVEAATPMEAMLRGQSRDGSPPPLDIEQVRDWQQMLAALSVRHRVFIDEQGVSLEEEIDEYDLPRAWDRTAVHLLGRVPP